MTSNWPLLSLLIWVPIVGGALVSLLGTARADVARWASLGVAILAFVISIPLFANYDMVGAFQSTIQVHTPVLMTPLTQPTDWLPAGESLAWRFGGTPITTVADLGTAMAADSAVQKCQVQRAWNITIRDGYGQTETTAQIGNPPGQPLKLGSMGRPLPGYSVALIDPTTGRAADTGEICLDLTHRPLGLMSGYRDDAARTAEATRVGF